MARSFSFDHYRIGKRDVRPDRRAEARGNLTRSQAAAPPADASGEVAGEVRLPAPAAKRASAPRPKGSKSSEADAIARSLSGPADTKKKQGGAKKGAAGQGRKARKGGPIGALPPVESGDGHAALLRDLEEGSSPRDTMLTEARLAATDLQRSLGDAAGAFKRLLKVPVGRRRPKDHDGQ